MNDLELARIRRDERALDFAIDEHVDARLRELKLAVTPTAKFKLGAVLKRYAKDPEPFKSCVRDNTKHLGPGRVEVICGALKDQIRKTGATPKTTSKAPAVGMSDAPLIDADVLLALDAVSEVDLQEIMLEARALEEHGTKEAVALLDVSGRAELERLGGRA